MNPEDSESEDMKRPKCGVGQGGKEVWEGRRAREGVGRESIIRPCKTIGQAVPMGSSLGCMMHPNIRSREWWHQSCDLGHGVWGKHCEEKETRKDASTMDKAPMC